MLNIISQSFYQLNPAGPHKVVHNLIKGLRLIHTPFVLNKYPLSTSMTLIHDDIAALAYLQKKYQSGKLTDADFVSKKIYIGPNIAFDPAELEEKIPGIMTSEHSVLKHTIFLCPSIWVRDFWINRGFATKILVWPTGVDTMRFDPDYQKTIVKNDNGIKKDVLVYSKGRNQEDVDEAIKILEEQGITYTVLTYGDYTEYELIEAALTHTTCLVIVSSESQGLALQELLALNIPLLVWNIDHVNQKTALPKTGQILEENHRQSGQEYATSVPYFDHRCGIIVEHISGILPALITILHTQSQFAPRQFILENLSLEKQAKALVDEDETTEHNTQTSGTKSTKANWRNRTWFFPILMIKYSIKYLNWKLRQ